MNEPRLANVKLTDIFEGDRFRENYKDLEGLKDDIRDNGLIHPIAIEDTPEGEKPFYLLAGGRRYRAFVELGYDTIPCRIYEAGLDEYDRRIIELSENLVRADLGFEEECNLIREIHRLEVVKNGPASPTGLGQSKSKTAKMLNRSTSSIQQAIELADAMEILPEIKKCKTKSDAIKMYNKVKSKVYEAELADRFEKKMKANTLDEGRKRITNSYVVKDFFAAAKELDSGTFHCVEVDPPYGIDLKTTKRSSKTDDYNEVEQDNYVEFLTKVVKESYRLLASSGWIVLWYAFDPWSARENGKLYENVIYRILAEAGFDKISKVPALWVKENHTGQCNWPEFTLGSAHEPFLYARKGEATICKPGRSNVFYYKPVHADKKIHPTERPIEMMQDILRTFCIPGGNVLVPFAGSGNTILAAYNLSMSAVGYDLSKEYKDRFSINVGIGQLGMYKSY